MSDLREHSWNGKVAVFAALMLFFQTVIGGLALGTAAAASPTLDIFGNPLCITGVTHASQDDDGRDHAGMPDCCTPGCSMFAPVTDLDRERSALANPLALPVVPPAGTHAALALPSDDHEPGRPRAPPLNL